MNVKLSFLSVAVAVAALCGCSKSDTFPSLSPGGRPLVFSSEKPPLSLAESSSAAGGSQTKTAWTGTELQWTKGDRIAVAYTLDGVWQNAAGTATAAEESGNKTAGLYTSEKLSADAASADFEISTPFTASAEGNYAFYAIYPGACAASSFKSAPMADIVVPALQTPRAASFDCAADILVGKGSSTYTSLPSETVPLDWDRIVAHAEITFKTIAGFTEGEVISKIVLTANSEAEMVGAYALDITSGEATKASGNTRPNVLTLSGDNLSAALSGGSYDILAWASFLPCTLTSLDVEITTDKAVYSRSVSSLNLGFRANAHYTLAVDMSGATRTDISSSAATIRDFAVEFVKCIPIWEQTVGRVDSDPKHNGSKTGWSDVHFIPVGLTGGESNYGKSGNQYDSKYEPWTLNVCGTEYTSAQAWEIAIRSLLNLATSEGADGLASMTTRNQLFTYADGVALDSPMPSATDGCKWGINPWYESDSSYSLVTYNGNAISTVGLEFVIKATSIHLARAYVKNTWNESPNGKINNYQIFGTDTTKTIVLSGYKGLISPMRELYILARVFKCLLDTGVSEKAYTVLKDQQFDFDMYHQGETF